MKDEFDGLEAEEARTEYPVAYIRLVRKDELENAPKDMPDGPLYALHDENGRPLAIFGDRLTAAIAARNNDFRPVSVH